MPELNFHDAQDECAVTYASPADVRLAARHLRQDGWRVLEQNHDQPIVRPNGLIVWATVVHPATGESPGDLLLAPAEPPERHEPGG